MPKRLSARRRWLTAASWPIGIALTSWDYMWRTTPMHRSETTGPSPPPPAELMDYPAGVNDAELQACGDGSGPVFHRRYRVRIRGSRLCAEELMGRIQANPNQASPTRFARFQRVEGEGSRLRLGDEYVVRMPGPWDGPVRVIDVDPRSFRLATLSGHLEAGQIAFRATDEDSGRLVFEIESLAQSSSAMVNLLYHRLRMAKEVQAHMWISFLERVCELAGGRMTGGIEITTERTEPRAATA